jgi:predicted alpha/beta superfamily hydrolase
MIRTCIAILLTATSLSAQSPDSVYSLKSSYLKDTRTIWVHLPPSYSSHARPVALTIVLDGNDARLRNLTAVAAQANAVLDFFDPEMPEQVVVGIESKERYDDFVTRSAATQKFIDREVIPFVIARFRLNRVNTVVGHSLAGRFALGLLCSADVAYYGIVAISPAVQDSSDARRAADCVLNAKGEHAVYVAVGDRKNDRTEADFRPHVRALQQTLDARRPAGLRWKLETLSGYSHTRTTYLGIPLGLAYVFDAATWEVADSIKAQVIAGKVDALSAIQIFTAELSRRLDADIVPSARWLMVADMLKKK